MRRFGFKGILYTCSMLLSLLLIVPNHKGQQIGALLFEAVGLPTYSNSVRQDGFNFPFILGLVLLLVSAHYATLYFRRQQFKRPGRVIFLGCILVLLVFPSAYERILPLWYTVVPGPGAVDYIRDGSSCHYSTNPVKPELGKELTCKLTFHNYGREAQQVGVRPLYDEELTFNMVDFDQAEIPIRLIELPPRSYVSYTVHFLQFPEGKPEYTMSWETNTVKLELQQGSVTRIVDGGG